MIYLVTGETGRGGERTTWQVAAWRHEISANTHAELANRWLQERGMHAPWIDRGRPLWRRTAPSPPFNNEYDSAMQYDFLTGTHYFVDAVKLFDSATFLHQEERPA